MNAVRGACLCGQIEFEVSGPFPGIYQCHCSQCRKATGAASNAGLIVRGEHFRWIRGQERIASYRGPDYRSDFCPRCGSPVPNPIAGRPELWVPAGSLEDHAGLRRVVAHLHTDSKASWDAPAPSSGTRHRTSPGLDRLVTLLHEAERNPG